VPARRVCGRLKPCAKTRPAAQITLLSGEPGEPYARMAIPYVLSGAIGEDGARQRRELGHLQGWACATSTAAR
jgi:hypothetical protein